MLLTADPDEIQKIYGGDGIDMKQNMQESLPKLLIIMTNDYCYFPDETVTMGVPVIWVIVDSEVNPPWCECVHIEI